MISPFQLPNKDTYELKLFPIQENSDYEYDNTKTVLFKGRVANNIEKKIYRITKGVNGTSDSVVIYCSNMPTQVEPGDKVEFLGKMWTVQNVGLYIDQSKIVNGGVFSNEYLSQRFPKGITLG